MGENICKQCDLQEINLQNIQRDHTAQYNTNPIKKLSENLKHLSKKDIWIGKKRFSALLITREMQVKTTVRYHLTPVRIAGIQKIHYKQ